MKSIDLRYRRTVSQIATVIVEVPDDFPEDDVANRLTPQQIEEATTDQWNDEMPTILEAPSVEDILPQDDDSKGPPHYRLTPSGTFASA